MAKDYSEDQLIQKSTAEFMEKELGWKSIIQYRDEVYNYVSQHYNGVA